MLSNKGTVLFCFVAGTALLFLAAAAPSAAVVIDFNDLPDGTHVDNQYAALGVVFSTGNMDPSNTSPSDPIVKGVYGGAHDGVIFDSYCNWAEYIQADFTIPVAYVSVDMQPFEGADQYHLGLELYNAAGALIAETTMTVGEFFTTVHAASPGENVAFARFYGYYGDIQSGINAVVFDNVTANPGISIDIKPGSDPNSINTKSRGVVPVAILTTEDFDALTVDADSVLFGPAEAEKRHKRAHVEDVDDDGDLDLVLHFRTQDTGIAPGDTEACLIGQTYDGVPVMGCDSVRTVPQN
jgi:hypothetical protein